MIAARHAEEKEGRGITADISKSERRKTLYTHPRSQAHG